MQQTAQPTPELFYRILTAFQQSAALKAAMELEIFTEIGPEQKTAGEIADLCQASERGIRILCDTMTILGLLTKNEDRYGLTDVSASFLDRQSPTYCGDAFHFIMSPTQMRGFETLTEAVRKGGSAVEDDGALEPENPMWVKFARGMAGMMFPAARMMAEKLDFEIERPLKILDLAAGHGIFGIMMAKKYPNAQVYAVDWGNVLHVASEKAEKFGVSERHHTIPGSAFEVEYGEDYDVILLTNFLHHFDPETCENLLQKINRSLAVDGKLLTLEFIPNDDRISPPAEAMFSLVMLAGTPSGDAYTFAELRRMFENSGFSRNQHIPLTPLPQHLVVSQK
ncbi:MAG: class I SAM-dependent methyltransferase [Pyrinomonadaceae bacterium]